ncbi:hypothetical protein Dda_0114 [Drechslerella dactyloides]|uniref:Fido domain-containing protein n=1 Tax=Drechslerella dactyloides TaxID=74499 RepID=A0AAD6J4K7_DREDA|nr:hypothetical protein Dda_0114 [Drechslerella dactyloides]
MAGKSMKSPIAHSKEDFGPHKFIYGRRPDEPADPPLGSGDALSVVNPQSIFGPQEDKLMTTRASSLDFMRSHHRLADVTWSNLSSLSGKNAGKPTFEMLPGVVGYSDAKTDKCKSTTKLFVSAASHIGAVRTINRSIDQPQSDNKASGSGNQQQEPTPGLPTIQVLTPRPTASLQRKLEFEVVNQMTRFIFGSNRIAELDLGLGPTMQLCNMVFNDPQFLYGQASTRGAYYLKRLAALAAENKFTFGLRGILAIGRRTVLYHAGALSYMLSRVIGAGELFSEDLIRSTYMILTMGPDTYKEEPHEAIEGDCFSSIYINSLQKTAPRQAQAALQSMPQNMKAYVKDLNEKLLPAEQGKPIDPFFIAAHAACAFAFMKPFSTANGRMCRLISNTILMKYLGVVAPIGEYCLERREYRVIMGRCTSKESSRSSNGELALLMLYKANRMLETIHKTCFPSEFQKLQDSEKQEGLGEQTNSEEQADSTLPISEASHEKLRSS